MAFCFVIYSDIFLGYIAILTTENDYMLLKLYPRVCQWPVVRSYIAGTAHMFLFVISPISKAVNVEKTISCRVMCTAYRSGVDVDYSEKARLGSK